MNNSSFFILLPHHDPVIIDMEASESELKAILTKLGLSAHQLIRTKDTEYKELGLTHVVITSVDRDDLSDGGAQHFVNVIDSLRKFCSDTTIEILTPDFLK